MQRNRVSHMRVLFVVAVLGLGPTAGCSDDSGSNPDAGIPDGPSGDVKTSDSTGSDAVLPPAKCVTPKPLGAGPYFKDVTTQYQLEATGLDVTGNRISSADLDGDGYPDLVVHRTSADKRDDFSATPPTRSKYVLMNIAGSGGGRTFKDTTKDSGFTTTRDSKTGRVSNFAVFADVNNDGFLDAFTGANVDPNTNDAGDRNEMLLGDGKGGFKLATQSGLYHQEKYSTTSAAFLDYDRDGCVDLFVGFSYEIYGYLYSNMDRLYKGACDGTFKDVTAAMGLSTVRGDATTFANGTASRPTWGVTACDIDSDGDTDLMTSSYGRQWNFLWRNDGTTFVDVGRTSGASSDKVEDYTDNEFYKCYCQTSGKCTAAAPLITCSSSSWNAGVDDQPWRLGGNTFTTVCGDIDNDGDMDLYNAEIRHWHIGKSSDPSELLLNKGVSPLTFERPGNKKMGLERTPTTTSWNEGDISAAFMDFDSDGLKDILLMNSDYPGNYTALFRQQSDHTFTEIAKTAGIQHYEGQEVTVVDLDADGDLDVVMGTSTMRCDNTLCKRAQVHVYENLVGTQSNWLRLRLTGSGKGGANASAIGARVKVTAGSVTQVQEVGGGYGHFGLQNDLVLHFGLGTACEADVEVKWPDAKNSTHTFKKVLANYLVTVSQAKGELRYVTGK